MLYVFLVLCDVVTRRKLGVFGSMSVFWAFFLFDSEKSHLIGRCGTFTLIPAPV